MAMDRIGQKAPIQQDPKPMQSGLGASAQPVEVGVGKHVNKYEELCKMLQITEDQLMQILANPDYADFLSLNPTRQMEIVRKLTQPQEVENKDNETEEQQTVESDDYVEYRPLSEAEQKLAEASKDFDFAQYDTEDHDARLSKYAQELAAHKYVYEQGQDWSALSEEQQQELIEKEKSELEKNGDTKGLSHKMLLLQTANLYGMKLSDLTDGITRDNIDVLLHSGKITKKEYDEQKELRLALDEKIYDYISTLTNPSQNSKLIIEQKQRQEVLSDATIAFLKSQNVDLSGIDTTSVWTMSEIRDHLKGFDIDTDELLVAYLANKKEKTSYEMDLFTSKLAFVTIKSHELYTQELEKAKQRAAGELEKAPEDLIRSFEQSAFYDSYISAGDNINTKADELYKFSRTFSNEDKIKLYNALLNDPANIELALNYFGRISEAAIKHGDYSIIESVDKNAVIANTLCSKILVHNNPENASKICEALCGAQQEVAKNDKEGARDMVRATLTPPRLNPLQSCFDGAKSVAHDYREIINEIIEQNYSDVSMLNAGRIYATTDEFGDIYVDANNENPDAASQKENAIYICEHGSEKATVRQAETVQNLHPDNRTGIFYLLLDGKNAGANTRALAGNEQAIGSLKREDQLGAFDALNEKIDNYYEGKDANDLHNKTTDQIHYCHKSNQQAMYESAMQSSNEAVARYAQQAYETRYIPGENGSTVTSNSGSSTTSSNYQTNPISSGFADAYSTTAPVQNTVEFSSTEAKTVYEQLISGEVSVSQISDSFNKLTPAEKQEVLKSLPKSELLKMPVSVCSLCPEFIPQFVAAHRGIEIIKTVPDAASQAIRCMKKSNDNKIKEQLNVFMLENPAMFMKISVEAAKKSLGLQDNPPTKSLQLRG